jgi:hypothetical protein
MLTIQLFVEEYIHFSLDWFLFQKSVIMSSAAAMFTQLIRLTSQYYLTAILILDLFVSLATITHHYIE